MSEPVSVREDTVRAIHLRQLAENGGLPGVRDEGMLQSALARPHNRAAYGEAGPDLAELAAAYAFGLVRNHPFADGNKRVALVVTRLFLRLNGADLAATQEAKYLAFLSLAAGETTEEDLAAWIRQRLVSARP